MAKERTGEAFEQQERLTVIGSKLQPGEPAPAFALDRLNATTGAIEQEQLFDSAGQVRLLNIINSVETPVCHVQTRRWEDLQASLPGRVRLYTISMDLPFAQSRWQAAEQVGHVLLSAHRSEQFGQDYGVLRKRVAAAATGSGGD